MIRNPWTITVMAGGLLALNGFVAPLAHAQQQADLIHQPYLLDTGLVSRSISFENPTGVPGQGGQAASHLGVGRKGAPAKQIKPGETVPLCDIAGPGTIRHIWLTTDQSPAAQRACVIRAYWEVGFQLVPRHVLGQGEAPVTLSIGQIPYQSVRQSREALGIHFL